MTRCLVTKLAGIADNDSLNKIGEARVHISKVGSPTVSTQGINFAFAKETVLRIVGDGYFTDTTLAENKGKTLTIPANLDGISTPVYFSNGDYDIVFNKYDIIRVENFTAGNASYADNRVFDIDDFKYSNSLLHLNIIGGASYGDLESISKLNKITSISLNSCKHITGDLEDIKDNIAVKNISFSDNVTGDISSLKRLTKLENFESPSNTYLKGDISVFANMPNLATLVLRKASLSGDISSFENTKLSYALIDNGNYTGDLSKFPSTKEAIFYANNANSFTWSNRSSTKYIFGMSIRKSTVDNIDKMLQDLSACQVGYSGDLLWKRSIVVGGTRTSASDDAVASLQKKGYTITINKA